MSSSTEDENDESTVYDVGQDVDLTKTDDEEEISTETEINEVETKTSPQQKEEDEKEERSEMNEEIQEEEDIEVKPPAPGIFSFSADLDQDKEEVNVDKNMLDLKCKEEAKEEIEEMKEPPRRRALRSQESKDIKAKDILESLPCVERLKTTGSTISGEKSETGENGGSDLESVTSGAVPRQLRNKGKKSKKVSKGSGKKSTLSTRSSKGKGRRSALKKKPLKSLVIEPLPITSNKIYYKGEYFVIGDIVSVTDISGDIFYGQLRGFLTDQFGEKSAVMSWLLPTTGSPPPNEGFHPATYIIGPEEEIPRKMEVFTFVMHAPSDYYFNKAAPYRTNSAPSCKDGFTTMRLGPRVRKTLDNKTIYVGVYS